MYFPNDEIFAKYLQESEEFNYEQYREKLNNGKENSNPVAYDLELSDPTPDIHDLFVRFDKNFFWGALGMVQVLWSKRMTRCAGLCYFEGNQGLCKISLSAPLLTLRPRKDLVETLLHEMIHAYLFVTHNYKDRNDHGPEFHKHMFRINKKAGTNITVYHTFHDEVEYYQKYVWRCDGPCKFKKPYFGFLKRSVNRAPGPTDSWWNDHKMTCGGTYIKISEPEKKNKKSVETKKTKSSKKLQNIDSFFKKTFDKSNLSDIKTEFSNVPQQQPEFKCKEFPTKDITKLDIKKGKILIESKKSSKNKNNVCADKKNLLTSHLKPGGCKPNEKDISSNTNKACASSNSVNYKETSNSVQEVVRNAWCNKFLSYAENSEPKPKKVKSECDIDNKKQEENHSVVASTSTEENSNLSLSTIHYSDNMKQCPICGKEVFSVEMNEHLENCDNFKFLKSESQSEVALKKENCSLLPCPCCYKWFLESEMNAHIDECLTIIALKEEREEGPL